MEKVVEEKVFVNIQSCRLNEDGEWEVKALLQEKQRDVGEEDWKEASLETFATDKSFEVAHKKAVESLLAELIGVIGERDVSLLEALEQEDKEAEA